MCSFKYLSLFPNLKALLWVGALIVYAVILNEKQKTSNAERKKKKKEEQEEVVAIRNGSMAFLHHKVFIRWKGKQSKYQSLNFFFKWRKATHAAAAW